MAEVAHKYTRSATVRLHPTRDAVSASRHADPELLWGLLARIEQKRRSSGIWDHLLLVRDNPRIDILVSVEIPPEKCTREVPVRISRDLSSEANDGTQVSTDIGFSAFNPSDMSMGRA